MEVFLAGLGVNLLLIIGIVGITEVFKKLFPKLSAKDDRWYILFSLVSSVLFSVFIVSPFTWMTFGYSVLINFSVATIFYKYILKLIDSKMAEMKDKLGK